MSEVPQNFYHLMFGLPADVEAPDHYELLGITRFEDDVERIRTAAIDRNRQLLSWQNSEFHDDVDRLMGEVVAALEVLLDLRRRAAYDRRLGRGPDTAPPTSQTPRRSPVRGSSQSAVISAEAERRSIPEEETPADFAPLWDLNRRIWQWVKESPVWSTVDWRRWLMFGAAFCGVILIGCWMFLATKREVVGTAKPASQAPISPPQAPLRAPRKVSKPKAASPTLTPGGQPPLAPRSAGSAPASLAAPFTATQAQAAQQAWAQFLGRARPVERNTIGLELILIPPGRFMLGDNPPMEVTLTQPLDVGLTEVTQGEWQSVMSTTPWKGQSNIREDAKCPATHVSWDDAQEFCKRLGEQENSTYRLLTEAEWEYACRAGTATKYQFGDSERELGDYAWYSSDCLALGEPYAHQVGLKKSNPFGLYDMHGNVSEWCADFYDGTPRGGTDPVGAPQGSNRVYRGGNWGSTARGCRTTYGDRDWPSGRTSNLGLRVARVLSKPEIPSAELSGAPRLAPTPSVQPPPEPASAGATPPSLAAPFTATQAQDAQQAWAEFLGKTSAVERNTIGLELVLIPPGRFAMGSPDSDIDADFAEKPRVTVTLTQPLYVGKTEVTQGEWQAVMNTTPWMGQFRVREDANCPATFVSWDDAQEFCKRLGEKESVIYRLLTEAEWEYACRAGTTTVFHFGDSESELGDYAWYQANCLPVGEPYAHAVGLKKANPFGLQDMYGNAWEYCADWHGGSRQGGKDPTGPVEGTNRVLRGGSWRLPAASCRSANRHNYRPANRYYDLGFRVARAPSSN